MLHLHLDPTPVARGEVVALTPEASVVSLGEIRLTGGRRYQVRRSTRLVGNSSVEYLLDAQGNAFFLEWIDSDGTVGAVSRNTGKPLTQNAVPARFRFVGDVLVLA